MAQGTQQIIDRHQLCFVNIIYCFGNLSHHVSDLSLSLNWNGHYNFSCLLSLVLTYAIILIIQISILSFSSSSKFLILIVNWQLSSNLTQMLHIPCRPVGNWNPKSWSSYFCYCSLMPLSAFLPSQHCTHTLHPCEYTPVCQ